MKSNVIVCRKSDLDKRLYFRSNRFFQVGDRWYFMSRENPNVGPYKTLMEAKNGLASLLEHIDRQEKPVKKVTEKPKVNTRIKWMG